MTITSMPAKDALDRYFLEARSKLLDIAAILDRIDRGGGAADPRLENIRRGVEILHDETGDRAEQIQQVFSLEYDANWKRPQGKR